MTGKKSRHKNARKFESSEEQNDLSIEATCAGSLAGGEDKPGRLAKAEAPPEASQEIGGRDGPDPTRFGDWEKNGRCIDF